MFVDLLTTAGVFPELTLDGEVEARAEVLERLGVVATCGGDGAEHDGEGMPADADPVGPGVPAPRVVEQRLADIEDHGIDIHQPPNQPGTSSRNPSAGTTVRNALEVVLGTDTMSTFANRLTEAPVDDQLAAFAA